MIGYCTKDALETHYRVQTKGISAQELATGKQDREGRTAKFTEDRQVIHMRNFTNEMFKFHRRSLFPAVCPPAIVLMYMIQSGTTLILFITYVDAFCILQRNMFYLPTS